MTKNGMWVDVATAATILKISPKTIYRLIIDGKLHARKPTPHSTQVLRESLCKRCSPHLMNQENFEEYPQDCKDCKPVN